MMRLITILSVFAISLPGFASVPLDLPQAIEMALANNPDVRIAAGQVAASEALLEQSKAAFRPQIGLQSSYTRTNMPMQSFGAILNQSAFHPEIDFNDPGEVDNLNVTGSVRYRLYNGGQSKAGVEASKEVRDATGYQAEAVRRQIVFAVERAWHQIMQARELAASQASAVSAMEGNLRVAQLQYDAGKFLKTEVLNLEVQLARAMENKLQADSQAELACEALLNLLGVSGGEKGQWTGRLPDPASLPDTEPAPGERPEVLAAKAAVAAAEHNLSRVKGGHLPTVDAFASLQYDQGFEMDAGGDSWMAGVVLNLPIYDAGVTRNRVKEAEAHLRVANERLRKAELGIGLEIRSARIAWSNARETLVVTDKMVEQAEESANLSRQRFETGVILSSELIDVENRLTEARMRRALAITQLQIAWADLKRALGTPQ